MPKPDWAVKAAKAVLEDLSDRRGIGDALDNVDRGMRAEIVKSLAAIIRTAKEQDDAR